MAEPDTFRAIWNGSVFVPYRRHNNFIRANFNEGETVYIEVQHERSMATHKHQFAVIREAFESLPERLAGAPYAASADALRKHALCATGYCEVSTMRMGSHDEALRIVPVIQHWATEAKGYAIVDVQGQLVITKTPMSQSMHAMGKEMFQASKSAVLDWIALELEIEVEDLKKQTDPA